MPVGICGTVLLIALNSAKSGISSCIYTGIGFEASSCLARNLLMLAAQILAAPHHNETLHNSLHGGPSGPQPTAKCGAHHLGCAHFAVFCFPIHTKKYLEEKHCIRRLGTAAQSWRFLTHALRGPRPQRPAAPARTNSRRRAPYLPPARPPSHETRPHALILACHGPAGSLLTHLNTFSSV